MNFKAPSIYLVVCVTWISIILRKIKYQTTTTAVASLWPLHILMSLLRLKYIRTRCAWYDAPILLKSLD